MLTGAGVRRANLSATNGARSTDCPGPATPEAGVRGQVNLPLMATETPWWFTWKS